MIFSNSEQGTAEKFTDADLFFFPNYLQKILAALLEFGMHSNIGHRNLCHFFFH